MVKIQEPKYKEKIKDYLQFDLDMLEHLKIRWIITENKVDERTKYLPFFIALIFFGVGVIIKTSWAYWWLNILFGVLSIYFIIKGSSIIRNTFTVHAIAKTEVEIIKYCIEVKKQNKESIALKLLEDSDSTF